MSVPRDTEQLLAQLQDIVGESLAYFEGPGQSSDARVGDWGAWEVLSHMLYWHRATAEGVESVARGGEPRQIEAETDEINRRIIQDSQGRTIPDMADEVRQLQARLTDAVRQIPDREATVFIRHSGPTASTNDRLEMMSRHWSAHVNELTG